MSAPYDPAAEGAHTDFKRSMSYGEYLRLDEILDTQKPVSDAHDEMLFIIQHQTSELWMRLAIHELNAIRQAIGKDQLAASFKMLARVARIFDQLNASWDVLRTMTPADYTAFRDHLGQSSGLQSYQYRMIEFIVGNRNRAMLKPHAHRADIQSQLQDELSKPSLYRQTLHLLDRRGLPIPRDVLIAEPSLPHGTSQEVVDAWAQIYRDTDRHWQLYELAEKLVDFEDYFRRWRFNHVTTVERVIGLKAGTGGTNGVSYLKRMTETVLFPELWQVRTEL